MKKEKKRYFGILLSIALMMGLMLGMSLTAYAAEGTEWNSTNSLPVDGGVYYLGNDVTVTTIQRAVMPPSMDLGRRFTIWTEYIAVSTGTTPTVFGSWNLIMWSAKTIS